LGLNLRVPDPSRIFDGSQISFFAPLVPNSVDRVDAN